MHRKTFVIEMPDSIDIQPETIVYALSYISSHDFVVTEAAQQSVHPTLLESPQTYESWLRSEFARMGFEFKPQSG